MCRWLAYSGSPVDVDRLLLTPKNSLIAQSLNATMGATVSNGDGFGLGWYGEREAPALYPCIEGSTDSELFFCLALTLGLETDPPGAVARAVHRIEAIGRGHGIEQPIRMTVAASDGERLWAFRYSSEGDSPSLFFSTDVPTLRATYPDNPDFAGYCDDARLIVSEPLGDLQGVWNAVPESSYGVVQRGGADSLHPFVPAPA